MNSRTVWHFTSQQSSPCLPFPRHFNNIVKYSEISTPPTISTTVSSSVENIFSRFFIAPREKCGKSTAFQLFEITRPALVPQRAKFHRKMASCACSSPISPPIEPRRGRKRGTEAREERKRGKSRRRTWRAWRIVRGAGGGVLICGSRENTAPHTGRQPQLMSSSFSTTFSKPPPPALFPCFLSLASSVAAPALNRALRRQRSREQRVETRHESRHPRGSLVPPRGLPTFV